MSLLNGDSIDAPTTSAGPPASSGSNTSSSVGIAQRAYHPDEVLRSTGALVVDYEWYLSNQVKELANEAL